MSGQRRATCGTQSWKRWQGREGPAMVDDRNRYAVQLEFGFGFGTQLMEKSYLSSKLDRPAKSYVGISYDSRH